MADRWPEWPVDSDITFEEVINRMRKAKNSDFEHFVRSLTSEEDLSIPTYIPENPATFTLRRCLPH